MIKLSKSVILVLLFFTLSLSLIYFYDTYNEVVSKNNINYKNFVMAISNIGISLLLFYNVIKYENDIKNTYKFIAYFILFIMTVYIAVLFIDVKSFGYKYQSELIYQIISQIFSLILIIYTVNLYLKTKIIAKIK